MKVMRLVIGLALLAGGGAISQTYQATPATAAYPALTSPAPLVLAGYSPMDNGRATVPLGFSFPFYAKSYTELIVTANGMAFLEPTSCTTCDYPGNTPLPSGNLPNGVIAPLWDDLKGGNAFSKIQTQPLTGPDGAGLAIEWSEWNNWWSNSTYSLTFQARLWQNGLIEIFYGPFSGAGSALSAGAGIEDPTGTRGIAAKPCTNQQYTYCTFADFTPNQSITFGPPTLPDLIASRLTVAQVLQSGTDLEITTDLSIRNWGLTDANGFGYRLYLSANTTFEPALDTALTPSSQGPFSAAAMTTLAHQAVSTVPRPPNGSYYVIAVLDDALLIAESDELNNVGATPTPLISGVDLVAQSLSGPVSSGPGEQVTNHIVFTNQGIDSAGAVAFALWLSSDNTLTAADRLVHSGSVVVAGGQTISQDVTYDLPMNIPTGEYWFVLQLDDGPDAGAIPEVSESNNVVFSAARFTARQADLATGPVELSAPAFFGEDLLLEATISNLGGATAANFAVVFYLSDNATLNGIGDPEIGALTGLTLAPGASMRASLTRPVPAKSLGGADLPAGDYFFFVSAVPGSGAIESNSVNNVNKSPPVPVRPPAPDLVPTAIVGPAQAGAGELMVVSRTLRNAGNRAAAAARYRYLLSANAIITEQDLLLPIETAAGPVAERTVTLGLGAEDTGTEVVRVPSGVPSATYYLGILVNPPGAGQIGEISYANNGLASRVVEVLPQNLRLARPSPPDAVAGFAYSFELGAAGAIGAPSFALKPGAGELPAGLALSAGGRLSGTPVSPQLAAFSVVLSAGGRTAETRMVLRVLPFTSALTITSRELAPLPRAAPYEFFWAATGGQAPYRWELDSGELPPGLALTTDGSLAGITTAAVGTTAQFAIRVRDASGGTAVEQATLTVLDAALLTIQTSSIPPALVGTQYLVDVVARSANGASLERPVQWALSSGRLPPGMTLTATDEVALIGGVPSIAGNYPLGVSVRDGQGRAADAEFILVVHANATSLRADLPARVGRGEEVEARFHLENGQSAEFTFFGGLLPPGLSLERGGALRGTVSDDAIERPYNFAVLAGAADGARALASFTIEVSDQAQRPAASCGCSGTGSPLGSLAAIALWAALLRRSLRRRLRLAAAEKSSGSRIARPAAGGP